MSRRPNQNDHVYLVAWSARGPTKVGVAVDPVARLKELQVACPYRLRLYFAAVIAEGPAIPFEQALLDRFVGDRLIGEWIGLGPRALQSALIENLGRAAWSPWRPTTEQAEARLASLDRRPRAATTKLVSWRAENRKQQLRRRAVEALDEWKWHRKQVTGG